MWSVFESNDRIHLSYKCVASCMYLYTCILTYQLESPLPLFILTYQLESPSTLSSMLQKDTLHVIISILVLCAVTTFERT